MPLPRADFGFERFWRQNEQQVVPVLDRGADLLAPLAAVHGGEVLPDGERGVGSEGRVGEVGTQGVGRGLAVGSGVGQEDVRR